MRLIDFAGPIGFLPSERHTSAKPPSNISQTSLNVTAPAGPIGLALASPAKFHVPLKYSIRLCSGAGFGGPS